MEQDKTGVEDKSAAQKRKSAAQMWVQLSAVPVALFASIATGVSAYFAKSELPPASGVRTLEFDRTLASMKDNLADMQRQLRMNQELVEKLNSTQPTNPRIAKLSAQCCNIRSAKGGPDALLRG